MSPFMPSAIGVCVFGLPSFFLSSSVVLAQDTLPLHPAAIEHLPFFITAPGQTDVLFYGMAFFMLAMVLVIGNLYFQLHAVPERMAHRTSKVQMEIVAVLALIALFTHNHVFWIAGLLLALIQFPDFSTPMASIAGSLEKLVGTRDVRLDELAMAPSPQPSTDTLENGVGQGTARPDGQAMALGPLRDVHASKEGS